MPEFNTLAVARPREGIALVTLNRPERLNAISGEMFEEIHALCDWAERDDSVRAVVLTGAGDGFCAGLDLADAIGLHSIPLPEFMRMQERGADAVAALRRLTVPVVAAVNGAAAGGGLAFALASDVRIASPAAKFGVAFIRLGLSSCDVGVSWLLPRIVGLGHASELMLTGRVIDAAEAERIGLVNRTVEAGALLDHALGVAEEIARNTAFGVRLTKQGLQLSVDAPSLEAAIALENRNQALASRAPEMQEAIEGFLARGRR